MTDYREGEMEEISREDIKFMENEARETKIDDLQRKLAEKGKQEKEQMFTVGNLEESIKLLKERLREKEEENDKLRKALEYYANPIVYLTVVKGKVDKWEIFADSGKIAQEALKGGEGR